MSSTSRRGVIGLLAGLPFIGNALASNLSGAIPTPEHGPVGLGGYNGQSGQKMATAPIGPRLPQWKATRLVLCDPAMMALAREASFRAHRNIGHIDTDLQIKRSFSPMAKLTYQRQRNVENDIERLCSVQDVDWIDPLREKINKLVWG